MASQHGYEKLLDILDDGLRDKEGSFLIFFTDTVEPIYHALATSNTQLLFDILGIKRYPITKKSEKAEWKNLYNQLTEVRAQKTLGKGCLSFQSYCFFLQDFTARCQSINQDVGTVWLTEMCLFKNCKNLIFTIIQRGRVQRLQSISCKGKL